MGQFFNIAIDGPAGAGKSTIAKEIAKRLNFIYVDTGAMYRAMALYFLRENILISEESVAAGCDRITISIEYENKVQQVFLNKENVSDQIRAEEVGNLSSKLSAYSCVREKLLQLQQNLAKHADVVMDGRDIGTCVLPNADLKVFLTASSKVRAVRRHKELLEQGKMANLIKVEQNIIERDHRDMTREIAPLKQADDAICVDGSELTIEEVVQKIIALSKEHGLQVNE